MLPKNRNACTYRLTNKRYSNRAGNSGGTWEPSSQKEFGFPESFFEQQKCF